MFGICFKKMFYRLKVRLKCPKMTLTLLVVNAPPQKNLQMLATQMILQSLNHLKTREKLCV